MASRPRTSGRSTSTWRSKRPARSSARSRISGRLVAAMMTSPEPGAKPSISTRSWLSVCSRSSFAANPTAPARALPMASSSSMKMMHGARSFACSNRSRTRLAPTPTNISTNSEPLIEKNGTPDSPATARARSVFPVPGAPTRRTPLGTCAPIARYFCGSLRKRTTSINSALRLVDAGNVVEGRALLGAPVVKLGLAAAERHRPSFRRAQPRRSAQHPENEWKCEQWEQRPDNGPEPR